MAVSGTTSFNLDIIELIEEAYEQAGVEARGGYQMKTAKRSLNLIFLEWANKGYNLWTVEERTQALTGEDGEYTLGTDVVDILDQVIRRDDRDYNLIRVPLTTHAQRPNKTQTGHPNQIFIDRQRAAPVVHLWPLPDDDDYTLVYWVLRRVNDAGAYTNNPDIPFRFLPAAIKELTAKLIEKKPMFDPNRLAYFKGEAQRLFDEAADEDREKNETIVAPWVSRVT